MILVTGANGNLGSQTIDFLLEHDLSTDIAGLVRSEEKGAELREKGVEIRIGDYNDYDSLLEAMEEVDTLLFISSSSVEGRVQQHQNVIDAAGEMDISHIFYTSILLADQQLSPLSPSHEQTESFIIDSGLDYTFYRHAFYGEFLPMYLGDALEFGDWYFPSDGQKINLALRSEMAEALANGLANASQHKNKVYEITSSQAYTLDEIADLISEETGKKITYHDISVAEFRENLEEAGLPGDAIMMSTAVAATFVNGGMNYTDDAMAELLDRKPADIADFLSDVING